MISTISGSGEAKHILSQWDEVEIIWSRHPRAEGAEDQAAGGADI